MRIAVIGIGAMGALFATRLSAVADVVMLGNWPEQLAAIKKELTIISPDGKKKSYRIPATHNADEMKPVDMVLVLVKSYQTARAAGQAAVLLSEESSMNIALTLQNGVGNREKLASVLEPSRAFVGVTNQAATIIKPGLIQDTGPGAIYLGSWPRQTQKTEKLRKLFAGAGFKVVISENIQSLLWGKLAVNAGINPLTAILNRPNGYVGENKTARQLMFLLAHETARVAAAQNIKMPYPDIEKHMLKISEATRLNISSMLRDVLRHSPTEIDAICGEVIKKGKQYGVPTPANILVFDMIKAIEEGRRQPGDETNLLEILRELS